MELRHKVLINKVKSWAVNILFFVFSIIVSSCTILKKSDINRKDKASGGYKIELSNNINDSANNLHIPIHVSYNNKKNRISALTIQLLDKDNNVLKTFKYKDVSEVKIPKEDKLESIYINDFGFNDVGGSIKISGLSDLIWRYDNIEIKAKLFESFLIIHDDFPKSELKILRKEIEEMKKNKP